MNRLIFLTLLITLSLTSSAVAQQAGLLAESVVDHVVVFRDGAQVFRAGDASLPAGRSTLRFTGLDPELQAESVQFKTDDGVQVLAVTHQDNFLDTLDDSEAVTRLKNLRAEKADSSEIESMFVEVYEREVGLLLANQSIGGTDGINQGDIQAAADFFRQRMIEVKTLQRAHEKRSEKLSREIEALDQQIQRLSSASPGWSSEIEVAVDVPAATTANFELNYLTSAARWEPQYDIRATEIDRPLTLLYKALIEQNTGEDWENVRLILSTANPAYTHYLPTVNPRRVVFNDIANLPPSPMPRSQEQLNELVIEVPDDEIVSSPMEMARTGNYAIPVVLTTNTTSTEFQIEVPYTIPSDQAPILVDIASHEIDADYEYFVAPGYIRQAYLTAHLSDWESYNLLPGPMNLFFNNTYVGQTLLDVRNTSDTLTVSLGQDQGIVIDRTQLDEFSRRQFLGNRKTDIRAYEISIRNNKPIPVTMLVEDQIPISTDSSIEVTLEEASGADFEETTGSLRWRLAIEPAQTEKIVFRYAVKYPRGRQVIY